jgi:hypothetical protein
MSELVTLREKQGNTNNDILSDIASDVAFKAIAHAVSLAAKAGIEPAGDDFSAILIMAGIEIHSACFDNLGR